MTRIPLKFMHFTAIIYLSAAFISAAIPQKPFYCMRHCVTDWNLQTRSQGQTDIPLNSMGRQQAEEMRSLFDSLPITHFWSSPLSRALETMKIINKSLHLPESTHEDLKERKMGSLEGITAAEWRALDKAIIDKNLENKDLFKARTERALNEILAQEGIPCIIGHSHTLRAIGGLTECRIDRIKHGVIWHFQPTKEKSWKMTELKMEKVISHDQELNF